MGNKVSSPNNSSTIASSQGPPKRDIPSSYATLDAAAAAARKASEQLERECDIMDKRIDNFTKLMEGHLLKAAYYHNERKDDFHAKIELRKKKDYEQRRERTKNRLLDMSQSKEVLMKMADNIEVYRDKLRQVAAMKAAGDVVDIGKLEDLQADIDEMKEKSEEMLNALAPRTDITEDESIENELASLGAIGPVSQASRGPEVLAPGPIAILPMPSPPTSAPQRAQKSDEETERQLNELLSS
jgi:hypothetical protein